MITLTKEWLLKTIAELEEERDAVPGSVNEDAAMALTAMKLARASLEANGTLANEGTITATQFKPVADLYEMQFDDGRTCAFHTDGAKAVQWLLTCDGNKVQEYVKLDRYQKALSGNSPVIPDGWVACSERMPHIGVPVITCCGDVVQYAAYAWDGKEWQDWYEEYDKLPANTFTHWHPRPAAPQQEVK